MAGKPYRFSDECLKQSRQQAHPECVQNRRSRYKDSPEGDDDERVGIAGGKTMHEGSVSFRLCPVWACSAGG